MMRFQQCAQALVWWRAASFIVWVVLPPISSWLPRRQYVALALELGVAVVATDHRVPIYFDSSNHLHRDLMYHPEQPARITACVQALLPLNIVQLVDVRPLDHAASPDLQAMLVQADNDDGAKILHQPFSAAQLYETRGILQRTHDRDWVTLLEDRCYQSKQARLAQNKAGLGHMGHLDADTYVTTESYGVGLRATACWCRAVQEVMHSNVAAAAMALTRPPGHHALYDKSNGFCLFNHAAAAAVHFMEQRPNARVSIIDWDVHYGQGVAGIIPDYERARYVSIHQTPAFPYEGEKKEVVGPYHNVMTIPMQPETSWTCGYETLWAQALDFVCDITWQPDLVIVCAGYDALDSDELAQCSLQAADYGKMMLALQAHLKRYCTAAMPGIVIGLEGGYQLSEMAGGGNLADAVVQTVLAIERER